MKPVHLLVSFIFLFSMTSVAFVKSDYDKMIRALRGGPHRVGTCLITVEEASPDMYSVVITENAGTPNESEGELEVLRPESSTGEAVLTYDKASRTYLYKISDFFGWTNLEVVMSSKDKILKVQIIKTRPDGVVYATLVSCE